MNITEDMNELVVLQFKSSCENPNLSDYEIRVMFDDLPIDSLNTIMDYYNIIESSRPKLFEQLKKEFLK